MMEKMIWNVTLYLLYLIQVSMLVCRFYDKNGIIWLSKAHENVSLHEKDTQGFFLICYEWLLSMGNSLLIGDISPFLFSVLIDMDRIVYSN